MGGKHWTHNRFVSELKIKQPDLKVIGKLIGVKNKIEVEDKLGIKYLCCAQHLLNSHPPSMISAIDKTEAFKIKLKDIQPNIIVIGKYKNNGRKILVRDDIGIEYECSPNHLLQGKFPSSLTAVDRDKYFEIRSKAIHGDKYNYSKTKYIKSHEYVTIICPLHGEFKHLASQHLSGVGCKKCATDNLPGPYDIISRENPDDKNVSIYLMEVSDNREQFYKVGLSKNTENRAKFIPYKTNTLVTYNGPLRGIYLMEQFILNIMNKSGSKYTPIKKFGGHTECFKCDQSVVDNMVNILKSSYEYN